MRQNTGGYCVSVLASAQPYGGLSGIIEGTNDADTLYREFILNLMLKWTNEILPLRFRDDVMSLTGSAPVSGSYDGRKKRKLF